MWWVVRRPDESAPQELYYEGWQTDKDKYGKTPLMNWVHWRRDEAIPKEL